MTDESSDVIKIRRAPNGKYYVSENGEVICVSNGNLRYFATEREALAFLGDWEPADLHKIAA